MSDVQFQVPEIQGPQPVHLANAFGVGFVAGLGFIFAQLLVGSVLWAGWFLLWAPPR